ncbi:MAG: cytidylate kinase family protein [Thermoplasmata archaeon]|nr:cytidylate kinase family protein [Thermoplasmata archaeon]
MIGWVIAIGGPPGSGKSTAGRRVAERLELGYHSAGELFRAEAARRSMDLEAFGRYAEAHPEVDRELDLVMQALARPGQVLDGRIQGILCRRNGTPVRSIIVTADAAERVRRVAQRDGQSVAEATERVRAREASERARYAKFYGIDVDREPADLTIDSTHRPPAEVASAIVDFVRAPSAERSE